MEFAQKNPRVEHVKHDRDSEQLGNKQWLHEDERRVSGDDYNVGPEFSEGVEIFTNAQRERNHRRGRLKLLASGFVCGQPHNAPFVSARLLRRFFISRADKEDVPPSFGEELSKGTYPCPCRGRRGM